MDTLLVKAAGIIFLMSLAAMMMRLFLVKGSRVKALTYLALYVFLLFGFSRIVIVTPDANRDSAVEALQAVELPDYLADSNHAYDLGVKALESKKYPEAVELLTQVIPGNPNYEQAQAKLAQAKNLYTAELLIRGKQAMSAGNFEQAVQLFNQALSYTPDLSEAKKLRLEALARQQTLVQAETARKAVDELNLAKRQMNKWQFEADDMGLRVEKIKVSRVIPTDYGFSYTARDNGQFLWAYVSVMNKGVSAAAIDPDNFYISTADGTRIARSEATFSQNHLPKLQLKPGSTAEGWIIFYVPGQKRYTMHYYGKGTEIDKVIVP